MSEALSHMNYHSELMKNYVTQVPVEAGKEFKSLVSMQNKPLIFSIGSDSRLRLICPNEDLLAPWRLIDLEAPSVTHFAVAQNPKNGEIRVAYSTFIEGIAKLYFSKLRDSNQNALKSTNDFEWIEHSLDNPSEEINKIEMNHEYMMFSTHSKVHEAFYYTTKFNGENTQYELPEFGSKIIDFKVGAYAKKYGTYLLYDIGEKQTLLFNPFNDDLPKRFTPKGRLSSIAIIRKKDERDHLLACGDHLFLYESDKKGKPLINNRGSEFYNLHASSNDFSSIWLIEKTTDQQTKLLFLTDYFFDEKEQQFTKKWTSDLPFAADVRQFCAIKGNATSNSLILLDKQNQLSLAYEDPSTTLWREETISVEALDKIDEFPCYTTCFTLRGENNNLPMIDKKCYVSSSSQISAIINGVSYDLQSEHPVLVKTDIMGALTIIMPVDDDISTPLLYIGYDKDTPRHILNPAHKLDERLSEIKEAKDFKEARKDDGSHLWSEDETPGDNDLDIAAEIIQKTLETKQGMLADELAKLPDALPQPVDSHPDSIWGAEFGEDSIRYLDSQDAQDLIITQSQSNGVISWFGHTIGSLFKLIKSLFGKLRSFVVKTVNKITTFILNIGGEIFHFIIDTLEKVFPFLKAVFDVIGLVFSSILKWLGRLLGWNDIWNAHKTIAKVTKNGTTSTLKHVESSVDGWKNSIKENIVTLKDEIAGITGSDLPGNVEKDKNPLTNGFMNVFTSPLCSWPMYQLLHSGALKKVYDLTLGNIPLLDEFVQKQAKIYEYVHTFIEDEMEQIIEFAINPSFSPEALLKLFEPTLKLILDTVNALIQGLLDFLISSIKGLETLFAKEIELPFFTPFYKFITGVLAEEEEFSFINLFSLMLAVPFTITYKIIPHNKQPFPSAEDKFGEVEMFDMLFQGGAISKNTPLVKSSSNSNESEWDTIAHDYQVYGGMLGSFSGMLNGFFAFGKGNKLMDAISEVLSSISLCSTIPVSTSAEVKTNDQKTALALRETQQLIGMIMSWVLPNLKRYDKDVNKEEKAIIEMVLSIVSLGTNISANVLSTPGVQSWIGHMLSRSASLVTGAGVIANKNPQTLVVGAALGLGGGLTSMTNAGLSVGKDINIYHGTFT